MIMDYAMTGNRKQSVVIVAGGLGIRAGREFPKQFVEIGGKPMMMHTIEVFFRYNSQMKIVVVLHPDYRDLWTQLRRIHDFHIPHLVADGGETRFHSVKNGLSLIEDDEIVAIHDAARPFVAPYVIENAFEEVSRHHCGVIPVVDEKNSVRMIFSGGSKSVDRSLLKLVQTPQVFPANLLKKAYHTEYNDSFTDDATVAEAAGVEIHLIAGNEENLKITTSIDFKFAETLLK